MNKYNLDPSQWGTGDTHRVVETSPEEAIAYALALGRLSSDYMLQGLRNRAKPFFGNTPSFRASIGEPEPFLFVPENSDSFAHPDEMVFTSAMRTEPARRNDAWALHVVTNQHSEAQVSAELLLPIYEDASDMGGYIMDVAYDARIARN